MIALVVIIVVVVLPLTDDKSLSNKIDLRQQKWFGNAICYSPFRPGQDPNLKIYPTQQQITEDLKILQKNWHLIRTYSCDKSTKDILEIIHRHKIDIKVMLGVWLEQWPENKEQNIEEIKECIKFAKKYEDIVIAISVGNEILAKWSTHKVPSEQVIKYIKMVKAKLSIPVTVAEDYSALIPEKNLLQEVDFITVHIYPFWSMVNINKSMEMTIKYLQEITKELPAGKSIVIGEAGWATYTALKKSEANVLPQSASEKNQRRYFIQLNDWAKKNNITVFFFEAFDEPWKGEGFEGNWGLFTSNRKPKLAIKEWYPELK
ncbi:MAG: hypothetical protein HQK51_18670 [Oligoflexia bacterium]|nr:hypothetical protein [Oligoflexia bacterium]